MKKSANFKKTITASLSALLLASTSASLIFAQDNSGESSSSDQATETMVEEDVAPSELQQALETAIELFNTEFPDAEITDVDIELKKDNNYEIQLEGHDDQNEYELEYNSATDEVNEREVDDDDDSDHPLPLEDLVSIDEISAIALEEAGFGNIVDWHLDHDDDSDRFVWQIEISESDSNREVEMEIDGLTGEILEIEKDD